MSLPLPPHVTTFTPKFVKKKNFDDHDTFIELAENSKIQSIYRI